MLETGRSQERKGESLCIHLMPLLWKVYSVSGYILIWYDYFNIFVVIVTKFINKRDIAYCNLNNTM